MVRIPFPFVAGAPPLDFVNTEVVSHGSPLDLLQNGDDLVRWLGESRLATRTEVRAMRAAGKGVRDLWLHECVRLRIGLLALFSRMANGHPLEEADLRPINDVFSSTEGHLRLEREKRRAQLEFRPATLEPRFLIARATAEFLASADLSLIRRCEGEGCILFFHDTTKSHTRRWCSMTTCGNRTKVKAHYERQRIE